MMEHVLVVDDDREIRDSLRRGLSLEGYEVSTASDGETAVRSVRRNTPDVVILDLRLPGMDGLAACRRLREIAATLPILILTARDAVSERVAGLEAGADDYLMKPFAFEELLARIRVRLRQGGDGEPSLLRFADLTLDTRAREAARGGRRIRLTTTEAELLCLFLRHPRQVLTRDIISERVWGYDFDGESKVIEVYVRYLREKLEECGEPRLIQTVRGAGYALRREK